MMIGVMGVFVCCCYVLNSWFVLMLNSWLICVWDVKMLVMSGVDRLLMCL